MATETTTKPPSVSTPTGGRDVHSEVNYLVDDGTGYNPILPADGSGIKNDFPRKAVPVLIKDVRGKEDQFSLDVNGFQYLKHPTALKPEDFYDDTKLKSVYREECEELLKKLTGASRVIITSTFIRYGPIDKSRRNKGPATLVHVDTTLECTDKTLFAMLGSEEFEKVKQKRRANLDIWRPIKTIKRDPFAVMDHASTFDSEFVLRGYEIGNPFEYKHCKVLFSDSAHPLPHPDQRWYYQSFQQPDEVVVFKFTDSDTSKAWRVPHTSFIDPEFVDHPGRESAETRAFLIWD